MNGIEDSGATGGVTGGVPADWVVHRREDREIVGWIHPAEVAVDDDTAASGADDDTWTAVDLLGREVVASVDWLAAEEALEDRGIAYLADPWMLEGVLARPVRVRLVEVTPARIVVKEEDFGDATRGMPRHELPWPIPSRLRPVRPDDPDAFTLGRPTTA